MNMRKLVREQLYENYKEGTGNSFGEQKCLELCKQYLPFLDVSYDDLGQRGTQDEPAYGQDEQFQKWDQLSVNTGLEDIDETGLSLYIIQEFDSDEILIKFYSDSVAYTCNGQIDDEYTNELEGIPIDSFTEEDFESVIEDLRETSGYDPDDYAEDKKRMADFDTDMHDKNSQWIKDNNRKNNDKGAYYEGQWEWQWDEELGKWLNTQDRYFANQKRGLEWDRFKKQYVAAGQEPDLYGKYKNNQ